MPSLSIYVNNSVYFWLMEKSGNKPSTLGKQIIEERYQQEVENV